MDELEAVLWELESAGVKPSTVKVSLGFWKQMQHDHHVRLNQYGDIFYRYLRVKVNPKQEKDFLLY